MSAWVSDCGSATLHHGDCLDALAGMDPDSVDAIVQDPPAGIGFMGRAWDSHSRYEPRTEQGKAWAAAFELLGLEPWERGFAVFMAEVAAAELRVAKPGAHSLTWALPRTADLTTLALRLAGWEVRDTIVHLFGQGFPKSLNVSKAIDKLHGATREVVGRYRPPNGTRWNLENDEATPGGDGTTMGVMGKRSQSMDVTAPATDDARQWDGWGTALSPGHEVWVLARKPLASTVARNVLAHGTGAINVDGCRTAGNVPVTVQGKSTKTYGGGKGFAPDGQQESRPHIDGRWPKNTLLSCALACDGDLHSPGCPVAELDRQSGHRKSGVAVKRNLGDGGARQTVNMKARTQRGDDVGFGDSGGASRFFPRFAYHPKASDRKVPGRPDLTNKHPTHKHPRLMSWLVRLVTPPGGAVLDPFMGSGTTGVACAAESVRFIGVEQDAEHWEVARARIAHAYATHAEAVAQSSELEQPSLWGEPCPAE